MELSRKCILSDRSSISNYQYNLSAHPIERLRKDLSGESCLHFSVNSARGVGILLQFKRGIGESFQNFKNVCFSTEIDVDSSTELVVIS